RQAVGRTRGRRGALGRSGACAGAGAGVSAECLVCSLNARADPPIRERILVRDSWRVAHNFETSLPGWLVAVPLRHITRLSALGDSEAAALGALLPLQARELQCALAG